MGGTVYGMIKTTVYLDPELKRALERLSRREQRSEAELIREAVRQRVDSAERPRPRAPLVTGEPGTTSISERVDELLADGFGR